MKVHPAELVPHSVVTVVGEALIDLVLDPVTGAYDPRPGGSPFNVAVGLARLGTATCLMARMADNTFGRQLRAHAVAEGVDLSVAPLAVEPTTLAVVAIDEYAQPTYDFYVNGTADWQWTALELAQLPTNTEVLHTGSIAAWTAPGSALLHVLAVRARSSGTILVSYDPNVRPLLLGDAVQARAVIERSVATAHVVKASSEDLTWLYPGRPSGDVAQQWLDLGPDLVVVTDGPHGATAWCRYAGPVHQPGRPTTVVDTVGAGDAFTSALLSGLVRRGLHSPSAVAALTTQDLHAVLGEAVLVSSLTCERTGADPPHLAALTRAVSAGQPPPPVRGTPPGRGRGQGPRSPRRRGS